MGQSSCHSLPGARADPDRGIGRWWGAGRTATPRGSGLGAARGDREIFPAARAHGSRQDVVTGYSRYTPHGYASGDVSFLAAVGQEWRQSRPARPWGGLPRLGCSFLAKRGRPKPRASVAGGMGGCARIGCASVARRLRSGCAPGCAQHLGGCAAVARNILSSPRIYPPCQGRAGIGRAGDRRVVAGGLVCPSAPLVAEPAGRQRLRQSELHFLV